MNNGRKRPSFIEMAVKIAYEVANRSEDIYKTVGAVGLAEDGSVVSCAYNGPPAKIDIDWKDRDNRRKYIVHAELNALLRSPRHSIHTLVCTMVPCTCCLTACKQHGVKKIVYVESYSSSSYGSIEEIHKMAKEIQIELIKFEQPKEELTF